MDVKNNIVVTFSEKEKETLRGIFNLTKNCEADGCFCGDCPFNDLCCIKDKSGNEEEFITNLKEVFE